MIMSLSLCSAMDISEVHANFSNLESNNTVVNVTGIVTAKYDDKSVVIQDDTAGMWIYDNNGRFANTTVGDKLNILGTLTTYNGLREIKPNNITTLSNDNDLPDPKIVNIEDINNDSLQGTLVKLYKVKVSYVSGKSFKITDRTGTIGGYGKYGDVSVNTNDIVDLTSIVGCYNGLQVNPRSNDDFKIYPKTVAVEDIPLGEVTFPNNRTLKFDYGIGSGAYYKDGVLYSITDRGPNIEVGDSEDIIGIDAEKDYGCDEDGKIFPMPNYAPTIFEIDPNTYQIISNITIKDKNGNPITGLVNPIPSTEYAYDSNFNELNPDPNGIDSEGIVKLDDGTYWISEEYGPSLLHVAADGKVIERIVPEGLGQYYVNATYNITEGLPLIVSKRHLNRGIEALALSPNEDYLYFALQSPIDNPDDDNYKSSTIIRLFKMDLSNNSIVGEYIYTLDTPETFLLDDTTKQKKVKLSEMTCAGEDKLIILERVSETTKLYYVKLNSTNILNTKWDNLSTQPCVDEMDKIELLDNNITPLEKISVFDNGQNNLTLPEKIEGIGLNGNIVYMLNDNDFGIEGDKSTISKTTISIPVDNINTTTNYGNVFFIQFADIHYCNDSEVGSVFGGTIPPVTTMNKVVNNVIKYNPDLVVDTGDIVALADSHDLDTDERWYKLVNTTIYSPITQSGIPLLCAPGNHDPAAYKVDNVDKSDWRYYNGLILNYIIKPTVNSLNISNDPNFNKTYYSYNKGEYHFVMIDPYETPESGYRAVILPEEQKSWLADDLANNSDKYIIIAYHQPLGSWDETSYNDFMNIISQYKGKVLLIVGHTHDNRVIYHNEIPEYQGGAPCGDWWQTGKTPDGNPMGYVIYYINNGTVNRFYKGTGLTEQINVLSPDFVVINGTANIKLNAYYENKTVANITYKIDNGQQVPLNITLVNASKIYWYHGVGAINVNNIDNGKHNITIIVNSNDGTSFNRTVVYKFSNETIMPISEIINDSNFEDYYGKFVTINGTISMVASDGNLLQIVDNTGDIIIWAGDCNHKEFKVGDKVILTGQVTQFKGTKELKLISDDDAIIYGFENISQSLIKLPNIKVAYDNFTTLKNKYVETNGIVTAVFGNLVVIQDGTQGIPLWLGEISHGPIEIGNNITIRGQLSIYNDMVEIVAGLDNDLIINGNGTVPAPKVITINNISSNMGTLVSIPNAEVLSVDGVKVVVDDGTGNITIYCGKGGFTPNVIVGKKYNIVGIASIYGGQYQIYPRSEMDITPVNTTNINNEYSIILKKGWNIISIPHNGNITFSNPNSVISIITYYNNSWEQTNSVKTLYGYFIYCDNETIMNINYTVSDNNPLAPPTRPITKGWNLVGVNPANNDVNGVYLKSFVLPIENIWVNIIDMNSNTYDKYTGDNVSLKPYETYWLYSTDNGELCGRSLN